MPRKVLGLGFKPEKRTEKNPGNIGRITETLRDTMENSLLGNPIDQNAMT